MKHKLFRYHPLALVNFYQSKRRRQTKEPIADDAASVVCPLCHGPLIPRCRAAGPYFFCYCPEGTFKVDRYGFALV